LRIRKSHMRLADHSFQPWPKLRYYPDICLKGLREPRKYLRIDNLRGGIRIRDLTNMKQMRPTVIFGVG
jgi:hypothetical protein